MNNLRPQSSSLWIYNTTIFSSKSIISRVFFIIFAILDIFLFILFFSKALLFFYSPLVLLIFIFYFFLSISFKLYVK